MGIKRSIGLSELNSLFPSYHFTHIEATQRGIIDTTYKVQAQSGGYILKYYERDIKDKIEQDKALLTLLARYHFNTPRFIQESSRWYLYSRLDGSMPSYIRLLHIQALARFMAKFHSLTENLNKGATFLAGYDIDKKLTTLKKSHYYYFKKFAPLQKMRHNIDGFIHGDLFIDNTLFKGSKIAVFDFIDGGLGDFAFDVAVALLSFNAKNRALYTRAFLQTYNQHAPKKLSKEVLSYQIRVASQFYGLLRIIHDNNPKRARLLAKFW